MGYVFFLGTIMLVATIALAGLMETRIQLRSAADAGDVVAARLYAQSAIEQGLVMIQQDPSWRSSLGTGDWFTDQPIGRGSMTLTGVIKNTSGKTPENDDVVLTGIGVQGRAEHRIEVTLETLSKNGGLVISPQSRQRVGA